MSLPTVLRCDQGFLGSEKQSVTFLSVPFLETTNASMTYGVRNAALHYPKTLYQTLFNTEAEYDSDTRQAVYLHYKDDDQILCVPQLWMLITSHGNKPRNTCLELTTDLLISSPNLL